MPGGGAGEDTALVLADEKQQRTVAKRIADATEGRGPRWPISSVIDGMDRGLCRLVNRKFDEREPPFNKRYPTNLVLQTVCIPEYPR